jgi:hypothetical protein
VIVVAAFEAPAVVTGLDDVTVVGQPVEQRGRHLGIAKHIGPLSECEIGGDDDRRALVEPADEVEQELAAGLSERKVAKFVKDDEVHPGYGPAVHYGFLAGNRPRAECITAAFYSKTEETWRLMVSTFEKFSDKNPEGLVVVLMNHACGT